MDSTISPPRGTADSEPSSAGAPRNTAAAPWRRLRLPSRPWLQFVLAFGVFTLLLVLLRGNQLWTSAMMNPDEAELMAEGRSAAADLFPFRSYTGSTHLFLWPLLLGILDRLGIPLTLVTAHLIGGSCYVGVGTTGWFLMMRRIGGVRATFLVVPTAAVLLLGYAPGTIDFLSMTSEALPMVILCVAALVMLSPSHPMTARQLAVGSLTAGLAIWAKPQSGPVALALVAACILVTCVERYRSAEDATPGTLARFLVKSGLLGLAAFAVPSVLFLGLIAAGGTMDAFVREPVAAMWDYAAHRDVSQGIVGPDMKDRLGGVSSWASSFPYASMWALGGLLSMSVLPRLESRLLRAVGLAAFVLPVVAGVVSIVPIYPLWPHYANLLYLACLLASCVAVRLATPDGDPASPGKWVEGTYFGLSFVAVALLTLPTVPDQVDELAGQVRDAVSGEGVSFHNEVDRDATRLAAECPADSRVLVWGWASELYAYYDWMPASRYANSTWIINPGNHQAEYGSILLRELEKTPPYCIVEAIGPAFFSAIDPANTLSTVVPGASRLLESCYSQSAQKTFDGRDVTLYQRKATCART